MQNFIFKYFQKQNFDYNFYFTHYDIIDNIIIVHFRALGLTCFKVFDLSLFFTNSSL